jgi:hypothetical protein
MNDLILSCPPAGPTTAYESLFSNSRHAENFVFDFRTRSRAQHGVSKDGRESLPCIHPSRLTAATMQGPITRIKEMACEARFPCQKPMPVARGAAGC